MRTTPRVVSRALYVALELSKDKWKLGFTTSRTRKAQIRDVKARDLPGFLAEVQAAKKRFDLPESAPVKTCYEAGRDGPLVATTVMLSIFNHGKATRPLAPILGHAVRASST
ncbi:hypothetical protein MYX84_10375 [Acidobacteria bacterium AH-259-O06]|nr:hypothetical protein [Acidobacteria bacterium AH-259-O06]